MRTEGDVDTSEALTRQTARRPRLLRVRVHDAELARWRASAKQNRVTSLSRWLRAVADQAVACGDDPAAWRRDLAALLRSVNAIGNNMNQIARAAACGSLPANAAVLEQTAGEVQALGSEIRRQLLGRAARTARSARTKAGTGGCP